MITEALIKQLKQSNVSKDTDKTRSRAKEVWNSATRDEQDVVLALTGLTRASIQRAYKTGSISAKIVLAFAQTMNVDPFYLTGEDNDWASCTGKNMRLFLSSRGYDHLLPDVDDVKPKRRGRPKRMSIELIEAVPAPDIEADSAVAASSFESEAPKEEGGVFADGATESTVESIVVAEETQAFINSVTEEEIMLLVKSILLRAKAGGKHAKKATQLMLCLLT